jgi:hypothetical protein
MTDLKHSAAVALRRLLTLSEMAVLSWWTIQYLGC